MPLAGSECADNRSVHYHHLSPLSVTFPSSVPRLSGQLPCHPYAAAPDGPRDAQTAQPNEGSLSQRSGSGKGMLSMDIHHQITHASSQTDHSPL